MTIEDVVEIIGFSVAEDLSTATIRASWKREQVSEDEEGVETRTIVAGPVVTPKAVAVPLDKDGKINQELAALQIQKAKEGLIAQIKRTQLENAARAEAEELINENFNTDDIIL